METFLKMADSACGKLKRTKRSHVWEAEALATEKLFSGRSHEVVSIKELQRNRENIISCASGEKILPKEEPPVK